ncbi:response regulator [Crenobacter sp. SG2305]|uniref:tetratricopeptide repeat protein n=1 Tax=Crenobacter oryzisoli TaxID=3056844 RepID=UPI0025AA47CB|nr:tetratricopeptide repeat protein [Crenobacter sp. SG2305]MDN0083097.1 response regulator [Crenobacter sp. SG2305]
MSDLSLTTLSNVAASSREASARRQESNPYKRRRILIVDSVPDMQRSLGMTLTSFGAEKIDYSGRIADALTKLTKHDYDIVLCDFDLGNGCDGLNLLDEARGRNLIKPSCVFILLTGERRAQRVTSAAELAPDDYLLKPFTGELLRQRLERAMQRRAALRVLDEAILRHNYLVAIEICKRQVAARSPHALEFMKLRGMLLLKISDFAGAKALYMDALRIKPVPWIKLGLAKALLGLKEYDEARLLFEEVLADNDQVIEAYDGLARLQQLNHQLKAAQQSLTRAVALSPMLVQRQQQLAEVALLNDDLDAAEQATREALELARHSWRRVPGHYALAARVQLARGDDAAALRTVEQLRRDLRDEPVAGWMANVIDSQIQLKLGHQDSASRLLDEADATFAELARELSPEAHMEYARACHAQGRREQSETVLRELVRNYHDNEMLLERIGTLFSAIGEDEQGRQLISESVQAVIELNNQAVAEAKAGRFDAAIEQFLRAADELPDNLQVKLNLVNATLTLVHRQGWHEEYMRRAHDIMLAVRDMAPTDGKFQKLQVTWRQLVEKLGKPQWAL